VTSAVFGLWHIRPTVDALRINQVAGSRRAALGSVAGAVAATAAAGLLLSGLRERSGSLAAPVLLHLSANSGAVLAGWAARNTRAAGISVPMCRTSSDVRQRAKGSARLRLMDDTASPDA
jgi:membrane protease YdiL (CAAX protease family)